ncbi:molybdenum cofactor guanylyltransferase [Curtobacterium sp. S6]|uniref:molybdenum cofactor guanylyltransferase n=1 Tax=Curtobacterium sp. S6 TaxID=1479623 RepID=UPI0004ABA5A1|nr:NTP transferase domain-containing protein [Curtobacterium sp. S6]
MESREYFVIVLAGGRSSRLHDSAPAPTCDKPLLAGPSGTLLERSLREVSQAVDVSMHRCVVVGPQDLPVPRGATVTREDPPFSGPASAIRAGLIAIGGLLGETGTRSDAGPWVFVTAADMPQAGPGFRVLREAAEQADAEIHAIIGDEDGRRQPLLSVMRWGPAVEAFDADSASASIRSRLGRLRCLDVPIPRGSGADVDTWDDAVALGFSSSHGRSAP